MSLSVRDLMPMFSVNDSIDGARVDYQTLWQRKNLLLVSLPPADPTSERYLESLAAQAAVLRAQDTAFIVTTDMVPGIPRPGVVVADRWGEIYHVAEASDAAALPGTDDLLEWLQYVRSECPECQGETR